MLGALTRLIPGRREVGFNLMFDRLDRTFPDGYDRMELVSYRSVYGREPWLQEGSRVDFYLKLPGRATGFLGITLRWGWEGVELKVSTSP